MPWCRRQSTLPIFNKNISVNEGPAAAGLAYFQRLTDNQPKIVWNIMESMLLIHYVVEWVGEGKVENASFSRTIGLLFDK